MKGYTYGAYAEYQLCLPKGRPLFEDLSFSVEPGGVIGLLGKNGAGKTSLLKIASGLLFAQGGVADLFGKPAPRRDPAVLSRIAYVPEQFEVPPIPLRDYVAYHAAYYPRFDHELMERYLQRFEITGNDKLTELSFGQQKKVLLSFALAGMAELVILDEPTNGPRHSLQAGLPSPHRGSIGRPAGGHYFHPSGA